MSHPRAAAVHVASLCPEMPRVPFEAVSVVLLAALVGAVVIARRD